jgi:hypothetical protein
MGSANQHAYLFWTTKCIILSKINFQGNAYETYNLDMHILSPPIYFHASLYDSGPHHISISNSGGREHPQRLFSGGERSDVNGKRGGEGR